MVSYSSNTSFEYGRKLATCKDEDRVVISGISGTYPSCENIAELAEALFEKRDLITDMPEKKFSVGKIKNVEKFDAQFFGITQEHAEYMDPMCRILLEKAYEAITDSGYNINHFRQKTVAVYVASCFSDAEVESTYRTDIKGALICERAQSFLANRISYWLGINGPSCIVNTACSSSLYAFELAYKAIRNGECEAALVGGSNLCLAPGMVNLYSNLGITSPRCRSFDNAANGFCRSEAISIVLLQKVKHARRVYAQVMHIKTNNDGYKKQTILFPSSTMQKKLINEVYEECDIPKSELSWVEAHGTGTRIGDYQEMVSLETLCQGRDSTLLCGCVKSSIGHTESTSGLCSIAKVIISMETGVIPPNINFQEPQKGIAALLENRIKVITEKTPWNGGYVAINNFGIGGSNAHLLLKSNSKEPNTSSSSDSLYLVNISGRTADSVKYIIDYLNSIPPNPELVNLLHRVHSEETPLHLYRGFTVLGKSLTTRIEHLQKVKPDKRPIWFIYPGMGSQWIGMAKDLMKLDLFRKSILECHKILVPKNINLIEILTSSNKIILQNILYCFVGITAMMISLTDLLESIGITFNGVIGHSFGEIGCAYADKCLTKKQTLKAAYYRGITSLEMKTINGSMAAIGLSGQDMKLRCPSSIEVVCRNGAKSCTIAGPADSMKELIKDLKTEGIFVADIYSANIAFHSRYISIGGPIYSKYLQKVIKTPRERSPRWISSSVDGDKSISIGKFCSAEYFVNNFLCPVNFENALKKIPNGAVTIEISPHSILKHVLTETLDKSIINISLLNKTHPNTLQFFLGSLGILYEQNIDMDLTPLYPAVEYPVSRGTPMIAPLIKWFHDEDWHVPFQNIDFENKTSSHGKSFKIDYSNDKFLFLQNCVVNGVNMFPESGYLNIVWETFTEQRTHGHCKSVIFSDIKFHKVVTIPSKGSLNFNVIITHDHGYFEVLLHEEVVCDGYIDTLPEESAQGIMEESDQDMMFILQSADIYKEFRIKGYAYVDNFQTILHSNLEGTTGQIKWTKDWILYLDSLFQFFYFSNIKNSCIELVKKIDVIKIDISKQFEYSKKFEDAITVSLDKNNIYSGGVSIKGMNTQEINREVCKDPVLQKFQFVPYFSEKILRMKDIITVLATIILENTLLLKIKAFEIIDPNSEVPIISRELDEFFKNISFFEIEITINEFESLESYKLPPHFKAEKIADLQKESVDLFIIPNLMQNIQEHIQIISHSNSGTFIISREKKSSFKTIPGLEMAASYSIQNEKIVLWHKVSNYTTPLILQIEEDSFTWVEKLQKILKQNVDKKIIIYSEYNLFSGIVGFFKCIRREPCGRNLRCFLILDDFVPSFCIKDGFYKNQIQADLAINVYKDGSWGSYIPLEMDPLPRISTPHVNLDISYQNDDPVLNWGIGELHTDPHQNKNTHDHYIRVHYATFPENNDNHESSANKSYGIYEFSGTTTQGNVAGISFRNRISNFIPEDECIYWTIPPEYSLKEGLTLPIAYLTVSMILTEIGKVELKTMLIQNAMTQAGQAAINLFLKYEYVVMTIEKNSSQKEEVERKFPEVRSFYEGSFLNDEEKINILLLTEIGPEIFDLMQLVSPRGYIFYVGNAKNINWKYLKNMLIEGKHFQVINLTNTIKEDREKITKLKYFLNEKIKNGFLRPLERKSNYFTVPGSIKRNLKINDEATDVIVVGNEETHEAIPKFICNEVDVYIVCGGLGGMGFELTDWLVDQGAKKLILVSRTGNYNSYQLRKMSAWQSDGIFIKISTDNIATSQGVENLLKSANQMGVVSAIFNTTLILQDGLFENLTESDFQSVANPKAIATIHLDKISRIMCPQLKHFVVFSSIACGYGNAGQTNYGYANSVTERVCEVRRSQGLPALAVEWAGVGDVGYLRHSSPDKIPGGTLLQPIRSCLQTLEFYLCNSQPVVSSFIVSGKQAGTSIKSKYDTIFTKIQAILDKADSDVPEDKTLKDLGLDSITVTETRLILEQKFNLKMSAEDILNLKLYELWQLEKQQKTFKNTPAEPSKSTSIRNISILEQLYTNMLEVLPLETEITNISPIVRLESYLHEGKTHYVATDQEPTIFFFPGIEGMAGAMLSLSRHVDLQVLCAQYDLGAFDVKEIASKILQEIESKLGSQKIFHMVGHSFGGLIAMEIVHCLEQKGKTGYLYLIDSSPKIVKYIASSLFHNEGFYENILGFVRALKTNSDILEFQKSLTNYKDWEFALKFTMQSLPDNLPFKKEILESILNTSYQRSRTIHSYDGIPEKSINSKVLFFKPKEDIFSISGHDLSKYFTQPIEEYNINGNHFTMLKTTELAHYIMTFYRQNTNKDIKYG
ncbi:fatty acid synthase-like [Planococcus citri]|uniref:fatty acid synthase-like n=1 Tax=Planococcus citri TaxID=170843 RepID=UPI0031F99C8F